MPVSKLPERYVPPEDTYRRDMLKATQGIHEELRHLGKIAQLWWRIAKLLLIISVVLSILVLVLTAVAMLFEYGYLRK